MNITELLKWINTLSDEQARQVYAIVRQMVKAGIPEKQAWNIVHDLLTSKEYGEKK